MITITKATTKVMVTPGKLVAVQGTTTIPETAVETTVTTIVMAIATVASAKARDDKQYLPNA